MLTAVSAKKQAICPGCGRRLTFKAELLGRKAKCPLCQKIFKIDPLALVITEVPDSTDSVGVPAKTEVPTARTKPAKPPKVNICHWCSFEMPKDAKYCPHCRKLRKDIHNDKAKRYYFLGIFVLASVFSLVCLKIGVENKNKEWFVITSLLNTETRYNPMGNIVNGAMREGVMLGLIEEPKKYEFSWQKFFDSFSGRLLVAIPLCFLVLELYYFVKVSLKLHTLFWV